MVDSETLKKLLVRFGSREPEARDLAAAELGDLLEADQLRMKEFNKVVRALLSAALAETNPVAKESMFNALSSASMTPFANKVNWDPIASSLDTLDRDCLEHAFVILGFSQNTGYKARIEPYLESPDADIRSAASDALDELDAASKHPSCKK